MNDARDTTVVFSAVLRPHRSSGRRTAKLVALLAAAVTAVVGAVFALAGAWPVLPFFGGEVLLLYLALRLHERAGRACETITLTPVALTVRRVDHWGKQMQFSFPPHWLQVNVLEMPGGDNRLELRSHGRSLAIAAFLLPQERLALAETLRRELQRLGTSRSAA